MDEYDWSYEDMVLQLEDAVDCLKVVVGDAYIYMFLFVITFYTIIAYFTSLYFKLKLSLSLRKAVMS